MTLLLTLTAIGSGIGTIVLLWPAHGFFAVLIAPVVASLIVVVAALVSAAARSISRAPLSGKRLSPSPDSR